MSMPKPVCPNMAGATALGPPGPDGGEAARRGCSSWTRHLPPPESVFRGRGTEGLCLGAASLHSGHLRGIGLEPGTWKDPGPRRRSSRGSEGLRIGLPAGQWRLRDACGLSRLNDLLALWSQAHMPSCNRHGASTSVHTARPAWLALLAVTHRNNRTRCLWLEQFQIADYAPIRRPY
jgi:hypothetical protein